MADEIEVPRNLWREVAGKSVHIPTPNSLVYYFPQGHLEHYCGEDINIGQEVSMFLCHLKEVKFYVNRPSDRVYADMMLESVKDVEEITGFPLLERYAEMEDDVDEVDDDDVISLHVDVTEELLKKTIFTIPSSCDVFPDPDDLSPDAKAKDESIKDINNNLLKFKRRYHTRPRMDKLDTTGWKIFKRDKKLQPRDRVIFMRKKSTGEVFVGLRRPQRAMDAMIPIGGDILDFKYHMEVVAMKETFQAVYCPGGGPIGKGSHAREFVVAAKKVEATDELGWNIGLQVRMLEGNLRGRVTNVFPTPWRRIEIKFPNRATTSQNQVLSRKENPWDIEYVPDGVGVGPLPMNIEGIGGAGSAEGSGSKRIEEEGVGGGHVGTAN